MTYESRPSCLFSRWPCLDHPRCLAVLLIAGGSSGAANSGAGGGRAGAAPALPAEGELSAELQRALDAFDEPAAQAVLDRLLADLSVPAVLRTVVLPYLAGLGQRWQCGTASIAMEHFPIWLPVELEDLISLSIEPARD